MTQVSRTTKIVFLVACGSMVAACCAYAFMYHSIMSARAELVVEQASRDKILKNRDQYMGVRALAESLHDASDEFNTHLLSSDDPIEFLSLLESIGRETGVSIDVESLEKKDQTGSLPKKGEVLQDPSVQAAIVVSGQWQNVYHLIMLLEAMPYALSIERIAFEKNVVDEHVLWEGQVHISVKTRS